MLDPDLQRQLGCFFQLPCGEAIGDRRHGDRRVAERHLRRLGDHSAIDPARVRHRQAAIPPQDPEQPLAPIHQFRVVPGAHDPPPCKDNNPLDDRLILSARSS